MITICKFGGSSLSNAEQFSKVKDIVLSNPKAKVVVCSACGKISPKDTKITDLLYILHAHLKYNVDYEDIWTKIYNRFIAVKNDLNLSFPIEEHLSSLKKELKSTISIDYLVSRGEYLTCLLMAEYLGYQFIDAKDVIFFDYDGNVNYQLTAEACLKAYNQYQRILVPGFYGSFPNGVIKTFSRGGSDITGAILARVLKASLYENWTDVSGFFSADPRIVKNPSTIKEITYHELRELSYMGANVLHDETIFPLQELQIPINVRNTNEPNNPGTLILENCSDNDTLITGIAGKKDFVSINIFKNRMSNEVGFLRKVLTIFERFNISIDHIPTGIDSVSVICPISEIEQKIYEIVNILKKELSADINVDNDISLVAIVGRNMHSKIGLASKIFNTFAKYNINVKTMSQTPQELNVIIGVKNDDYEKTIHALYSELIENGLN